MTAHARWLVLALAAAIAVATFPYVAGLLGAVVLAVWLAPVHRWLARRVPPRWAGIALVLATALVTVGAGSWLVSALAAEARELLARVTSRGVPALLAGARIGGVDVAAHAASVAAALLSWLSGQAVSVIGSATHATLNLVIALFGLFYLLVDQGTLWPWVERVLPFPSAVAERLRARFVAVTEAMLLGTVLTAVLQGTIVGAAFAVVGLPGAVLWGVVTACVSILPVMGSALVWLPGVAVLLFRHRPVAALGLALVGAVLASNIDNAVRLIVYRRVSGVHPMITLVGAFAGVRVFGLVGVLLGPLALLYFVELLAASDAAGPSEGAVHGDGAESGDRPPRHGRIPDRQPSARLAPWTPRPGDGPAVVPATGGRGSTLSGQIPWHSPPTRWKRRRSRQAAARRRASCWWRITMATRTSSRSASTIRTREAAPPSCA